MPILSPEADRFPNDLLDEEYQHDEPPAADTERRWWLIYARSRREKDLMRRLHAERAAFYGPTIRRRNRSPGGRVRESSVLLFPGYVFLFGSEDDRRLAWTTGAVSTITPVEDQCGLVVELRQIAQLIATNVPLAPEQRLHPGQEVRVVSGPLKGQQGVVIQRRGRRRLLVAIELLQRGASADLDECDVRPI